MGPLGLWWHKGSVNTERILSLLFSALFSPYNLCPKATISQDCLGAQTLLAFTSSVACAKLQFWQSYQKWCKIGCQVTRNSDWTLQGTIERQSFAVVLHPQDVHSENSFGGHNSGFPSDPPKLLGLPIITHAPWWVITGFSVLHPLHCHPPLQKTPLG